MKEILAYSAAIIGLLLFPLRPPTKNLVKNSTCEFKVHFENSSSLALPFVGLSDLDEDYSYSNFGSGTFVYVGFDDGPTVEIAVQFPAVHPAGRIRITDFSGQVISCSNIPANSSNVFLYFLSASCGSTYFVYFEELPC